MKSLVFATAMSAAFAAAAFAQQADCRKRPVHVYREAIVYAVDSIPGWSFNCDAGRADTLAVVLYRRGPDARRSNHVRELARRSLRTRDGQPVTVRDFVSQSKALFERVAYVPVGSAVGILGLKARDQASFDRNLTEFERLVQAYAPVRQP